MDVLVAAPDDPLPAAPPVSAGSHTGIATPCVFGDCRGFLHLAATAMAATAMAGTAVPGTDLAGTDLAGTGLPGGGAALGVVLCPPWGFEDLTMRKGWRLLAEAVAAAGYPCLRFDYPGTGDSAGRATDVTGVRQWVEAIGDAADLLGRQTSVSRFVFVGQSLGAALAVEAARSRDDVVGLQLIAPVVKGRAYVRELAATATLVADKVGIKVDLAPDEGLSVLGFALSHAMVADVRALDLTAADRLAVRWPRQTTPPGPRARSRPAATSAPRRGSRPPRPRAARSSDSVSTARPTARPSTRPSTWTTPARSSSGCRTTPPTRRSPAPRPTTTASGTWWTRRSAAAPRPCSSTARRWRARPV